MNVLMLLRNELAVQVRQPLLALLALVAPVFGFVIGKGLAGESGQDPTSLPAIVRLNGALAIMAMPWVASVLAHRAFLRDSQYGMEAIVVPLPRPIGREYAARMAGVSLLIGGLLVLAQIGLAGGLWSRHVDLRSASGMAALLINNVVCFWLIAVPAILLFSALLGWLTQWSRHPLGLHVAAMVLFGGYMALASATGSPLLAQSQVANERLVDAMRLVDWYGLTSLQRTDGAPWMLPVNRLATLALAFACAMAAIARATRQMRPATSPARPPAGQSSSRPAVDAPEYRAAPVRRNPLQAFVAEVTLQSRQMLQQRSFVACLLLWAGLVVTQTAANLRDAGDLTELSPTSVDAINQVMWDAVPLFTALLLVFWCYELVWRDRACRFHEVYGATRLSPALQLAARSATVTLVLGIWLAITSGLVMAVQIAGRSPIDLAPYGWFIVYSGVPLICQALVCLAVLAIVPSRVLGLAGCVVILLLRFTPLASMVGVHHPLASLFATPLSAADLVVDYQPNAEGFVGFAALWSLVAAVAVIAPSQRYHRGGLATRRWPSRWAWIAVAGLTLLAARQATHIHRELAVDGALISAPDRDGWRAAYERRFARFATMPQPEIVRVDANVAFHPDQRRVDIEGGYQLANRGTQPIREILVGEYRRVPLAAVGLAAKAEVEWHPDLHQRIYRLAQPLEPGGVVTLKFRLLVRQTGFGRADPLTATLTRDFSYLRSVPHVPTIGYQPLLELADSRVRAEQHLPPRPSLSVEQALRQRDRARDRYHFVTMHTVLSTPRDHVGVTQGTLVRRWEAGGRQYREYATGAPVANVAAYVSAPYQVATRMFGGRALQVAHVAGHDGNVSLTLDAMQHTMALLEEVIGPYGGTTLTLIEKPDAGPTGYALPHVMLVGSRVGFRATSGDGQPFSQVYRRAVHETAHQWFGHQLGSGIPADGAFLIESMAKYVELVVLERHRGKAEMDALVEYERRRYRQIEGLEHDRPTSLIGATDGHDQYSRATLAFAVLRARLGDAPILAALKAFAADHLYPNPPASSLDFVDELERQVAAEHRPLVRRLLTAEEPFDVSMLR